jgi:hypothetical protein
MKPAAVEKRTERKVRSAILQAMPPWLNGIKDDHMPMTPATLRRLGLWLSTFSEAAAFLGVSVDTLSRRMQAYPVLRRAWDEGHEKGRSTLRRRQLEIAYSDAPQAAMLLIHLGKTLLNQRDKIEHSGEGGGPIKFNQIRRVIVDPAAPEGQQETDMTQPERPQTRH